VAIGKQQRIVTSTCTQHEQPSWQRRGWRIEQADERWGRLSEIPAITACLVVVFPKFRIQRG
jgi:hypothetical protein